MIVTIFLQEVNHLNTKMAAFELLTRGVDVGPFKEVDVKELDADSAAGRAILELRKQVRQQMSETAALFQSDNPLNNEDLITSFIDNERACHFKSKAQEQSIVDRHNMGYTVAKVYATLLPCLGIKWENIQSAIYVTNLDLVVPSFPPDPAMYKNEAFQVCKHLDPIWKQFEACLKTDAKDDERKLQQYREFVHLILEQLMVHHRSLLTPAIQQLKERPFLGEMV